MALARFGYLWGQGYFSGILFIFVGGTIWIYSTFRYRHILNLLKVNKYEPNRFGVVFLSSLVFLATIIEATHIVYELLAHNHPVIIDKDD